MASGCAADSGIEAGEQVTVYVSMPLHGPAGADGRDVVAGAKLALTGADGKAGDLAVHAVYVDDAAGHHEGARWSPVKAAANARQATEDSSAIAYLGDFDSGATRYSLPITNEAHMLQVSPASAAVDLVQPFLGAGDQVPEGVQPSGDRTFGRVIPSDEVQAEAAAAWAKRLGTPRVAAVSDGSRFGDTLVASFREAITGSATASADRADLIYYGGSGDDAPAPIMRVVQQPCPHQTLMGSDALLGSALLLQIPRGRFACPAILTRRQPPRGVFVTSAAEDPKELPPAGQRFVRGFRKRYGRKPGRYAAYGYEAMAVTLDSIRRAGESGDDRDSVVSAFFDTTDRNSILGEYSIDEVGNTTLDRLAGYRVFAGRPVFTTALRGR